ncbi:hypothetical protein FALBO_468 [Fusarium albosuccineum]|uniref:Zn(2)-C6 fungal-type domain-containing protein n=1 Tax=Fusarium albosuccineum TaxID=1237068 RepID=A0A8H4LPU3_9HYPO|nr:hypothetical protein FALBO_468 [Fusarium albosuccineum]
MAPTSSRSSLTRRACDGCRRRKVKCDAEEPCSNCRISQLACQYITPRKKRGPSARVARIHSEPRDLGASASRASVQEGQSAASPDLHQVQPSPRPLENVSNGRDIPDGSLVDSPQSLGLASSNLVAASAVSLQLTDSTDYAQAIRDALLTSIRAAVPAVSAEAMVNKCIDLYMQYTFPSIPIVHEPSLRSNAAKYFSDSYTRGLFSGVEEHERVTKRRGFALITALCASVTSVMPPSVLSYGHLVANLFLRASQKMLKSYEEYDIELPDSTSMSIRNLHCTAAQHITGKKSAAFHVMGEASLIAQSLRLYDEQSIIRSDPVEGQLLRLNFWHLYMSDKASVCFGSRPCVLHELLFDGKLTLHPYGLPLTPLLDTTRSRYENSFEERVLVSFSMVARLWSSAASILLGMRNYDAAVDERSSLVMRLTSRYLDFIGTMDSLPHWLQLSSIISSSEEGHVNSFQYQAFWVQRCTLTMTFHCLRLLIMQQCIDSAFLDIMGISDQPLALAIKKSELIHDFIQTMEDIPFIYHQVKGEPSVERIRRVGIILLEMAQTVSNDAIRSRVEGYFRRLLDTLAKLNSKASEELTLR